jgi:hypothetical protein
MTAHLVKNDEVSPTRLLPKNPEANTNRSCRYSRKHFLSEGIYHKGTNATIPKCAVLQVNSKVPLPPQSNELLIWRVIAVFAVVTLASCWWSGLSFDPSYAVILIVVVSAFLGVSLLYSSLRPDPQIALAARTCAQLIIMLALGLAMIYPLATLSWPYRDADFHAMDRFLGLDWVAYLRFVNARPVLALLLENAYNSILLQLAALVVALCAQSNLVRLQQYVLAIIVASSISLAIFAVVPAGGTYAHLNIAAVEFANLSPATTASQMDTLDMLRSGQLSHILDMEGLITFPSFHSVWAVLFMWGFFSISRLRVPAIILNLLVLAATPLYGAHYFVDLFGGVLIAALSVTIAGMLVSAKRSTHASPSSGSIRVAER